MIKVHVTEEQRAHLEWIVLERTNRIASGKVPTKMAGEVEVLLALKTELEQAGT